MGGNEVWSLEITFRQPKRRRTDTSDVARDLDERGYQAFYWNSRLRYTRNWVMISLSLFRPYLPFYIMETGQNWYRWKATIMENPTPSVARILDQNSRKTSGFTGKQSRGLSEGLLTLPFPGSAFQVALTLSC